MMPQKPGHPCSHYRCPNLAVLGSAYCEQHKAQDTKRQEPRKQEGYDGIWEKLRKIVLNNEPLCRICRAEGRITPATEVDHKDGNVWNRNLDNLQPLCKSCHSRKTATENGAFGNQKSLHNQA